MLKIKHCQRISNIICTDVGAKGIKIDYKIVEQYRPWTKITNSHFLSQEHLSVINSALIGWCHGGYVEDEIPLLLF